MSRYRQACASMLVALGMLAFASTLSSSRSAFGDTTATAAGATAGELAGTNAPAVGVASFSGEPTSSGCQLTWTALTGGTAVADRFELLREPSLSSLLVTGTVGAGTTTIGATPTVSSYRLRTRAATTWISSEANSATTTCVDGGQLAADAGDTATCGIQADESLWCWGFGEREATAEDGYATTTAPRLESAGPWRQVSVGTSHACAIRTDDTLWCWGINWAGQLGDGTSTSRVDPAQIGTATDWTMVVAFGHTTCGIRAPGSLWCWGRSDRGQVGHGTTASQFTPIQVGAATDWTRIVGGANHTCGVRSDNSMSCWGENTNGQLGDSTTTNRLVPGLVDGGSVWSTSIAAGLAHTCAVRIDSTLWCWGTNWFGEGGATPTPPNSSPVQAGTDRDWAQIVAGRFYSCATKTDHSLWCGGDNLEGRTGLGLTSGNTGPFAQVGAGTDWAYVTAGKTHGCGGKLDGTLWCWGNGRVGQTGQPDVTWQTPQAVDGATDWAIPGAGYRHSCAIKTDASLWCWGNNESAQIGSGDYSDGQFTPNPPAPGTAWNTLSTADFSSCALQTAGTLWCWGGNHVGQLGDGTYNNSLSPVQIGAANDWSAVGSGRDHFCGVRAGGELWCWGNNYRSKLGDGTTTTRNIPVPIGAATSWTEAEGGFGHTCGLRADSTLWCWGANGWGALGLGSGTDSSTPTQVGTDTDWADIGLGREHSCAVKAAGTLWCWGRNSEGQIGDGTTTVRTAPVQVGTDTDWASVEGGHNFTCATKTDNTLWCWGRNGAGQFGSGTVGGVFTTPAQYATSIASFSVPPGAWHVCAVTVGGSLHCAGSNEGGQLGYHGTDPDPVEVVGGATWPG